jgi:hypothetical protein
VAQVLDFSSTSPKLYCDAPLRHLRAVRALLADARILARCSGLAHDVTSDLWMPNASAVSLAGYIVVRNDVPSAGLVRTAVCVKSSSVRSTRALKANVCDTRLGAPLALRLRPSSCAVGPVHVLLWVATAGPQALISLPHLAHVVVPGSILTCRFCLPFCKTREEQLHEPHVARAKRRWGGQQPHDHATAHAAKTSSWV